MNAYELNLIFLFVLVMFMFLFYVQLPVSSYNMFFFRRLSSFRKLFASFQLCMCRIYIQLCYFLINNFSLSLQMPWQVLECPHRYTLALLMVWVWGAFCSVKIKVVSVYYFSWCTITSVTAKDYHKKSQMNKDTWEREREAGRLPTNTSPIIWLGPGRGKEQKDEDGEMPG